MEKDRRNVNNVHSIRSQSGFMCMMFYRRDTHVAEIQMGSPAMRLEDACAPDHFDINKLQFVTLLGTIIFIGEWRVLRIRSNLLFPSAASNPESEVCPLDGLYGLRGAIGPPYIPSRHKRNHNQRSAAAHNNTGHSVFNHDAAATQRRSRSPLSFRSGGGSEQWTRDAWRQPTRGIAVRNRRDTAEGGQEGGGAKERNGNQRVDSGRFRRNTGNCVVNYNSRRQLLVGCTETNVIEVHPYCTEDNDEGGWRRQRRRDGNVI